MLNAIEQRLPTLTPAERRVGYWVLSHPRQAAAATVATVASACGTSQPTVIRFCRRMGLRGFRDLGRSLTEALSSPVSYVHRDVSSDDAAPDAIAKVMDASIQALIDVRSNLSAMPIEAAVTALAAARQIAFAGLGASGQVASDACQKFFRLGTPCSALTDTPMMLQFAAITEPGDVLVIISQTGRWPELARTAELAQNNGATVIGLTDPGTTLASAVDLLFPQQTLEDSNVYTPMSSRLAQLALLDALQVALALAVGDPAARKLRRAKQALTPAEAG